MLRLKLELGLSPSLYASGQGMLNLGPGGVAWTPAELFASGEVGGAYWITPDFAGLYQDSAGTTPVTALGQPVGRIDDRSGNGNHLTASGTARPTIKNIGGIYCIEHDGVDDLLTTASVDFTATDAMTVVTGVTKYSDASGGWLMSLTADPTANPGFLLSAPAYSGGAGFGFSSRGTSFASANDAPNSPGAALCVVSGQSDVSTDTCILRVNGAVTSTAASDQGSGNYSNSNLYVGIGYGGSGAQFNGYWSSLVIRGASSTVDELDLAEHFAANLHGVTL